MYVEPSQHVQLQMGVSDGPGRAGGLQGGRPSESIEDLDNIIPISFSLCLSSLFLLRAINHWCQLPLQSFDAVSTSAITVMILAGNK